MIDSGIYLVLEHLLSSFVLLYDKLCIKICIHVIAQQRQVEVCCSESLFIQMGILA